MKLKGASMIEMRRYTVRRVVWGQVSEMNFTGRGGITPESKTSYAGTFMYSASKSSFKEHSLVATVCSCFEGDETFEPQTYLLEEDFRHVIRCIQGEGIESTRLIYTRHKRQSVKS